MLAGAGLLTVGCAAPPAPAPAAVRRVRDDLGRDVDVPADPQRVVVLDPNHLPPLLGEAASRIEAVGPLGQVSVESIVGLEPDLILFAADYQDDLDPEVLQRIVPTVAYSLRPSVQDHLRFVASVLGREGAAEDLISGFDAVLAARRAELGLADRPVAGVGMENSEAVATVDVTGPDSVFGELLTGLGVRLVPATVDGAPVEGLLEDLSAENLGTLLGEAETLIVSRRFGGDELERGFAATVDSPVWTRLPAVAAGRVAYVDNQLVYGSFGLRGFEVLLDDIAAQLG
ncbi:ABC transporter substrate-binding protein [Pseudonocardia broussonetiae]|uniref:ABC transporter substrate-binding protein n=1 Tax=Pseudonocardia broussonetiae TaxID=2736640 RepID=A0A6M6JSD0_9PSEU|nr:ABC transporter substrate-binding protein [Pseudonocardia broussonetiae]QJY49329.1 ABC transporter substrate-binding protein [Pseudonocardia broussonetiae]